jgi:hypothetical protein
MLNDKLAIAFGKLNFNSFFTSNKYFDDSNSKFITSLFSKDKIVEASP